MLQKLGVQMNRNGSGSKFFGFSRKDVRAKLLVYQCSLSSRPILKSIQNVLHRNAGPTNKLHSRHQVAHNSLIFDTVEEPSFGDVKSKYT